MNISEKSYYENSVITLTTKHQKIQALKKPLADVLKANLKEFEFDTDQLGTFSGEIERKGSSLEVARRKCEVAVHQRNAAYALASEGSFGPHPNIPFVPIGREILYFIDKVNNFEVYVSEIYTETNYRMQQATDYEEVLRFASNVKFPSHGLILRPFPKQSNDTIFKGISSYDQLEHAYKTCLRLSPESKVWVETDMRAHFNPTRMMTLELLGYKLATRLLSLCPNCNTPGWGEINVKLGLPCKWCGNETNQVKSKINGCAKCSFSTEIALEEHADPAHCVECNP